IAGLVVEGGVFVGGQDVGVIAQAIEKLRAVGLGVDGLKLDPLDKFAVLRAVGLGVDVGALLAFPDARQAPQRPQIGQGVVGDVVRLGENIVENIGHDSSGSQIGAVIGISAGCGKGR